MLEHIGFFYNKLVLKKFQLFTFTQIGTKFRLIFLDYRPKLLTNCRVNKTKFRNYEKQPYAMYAIYTK